MSKEWHLISIMAMCMKLYFLYDNFPLHYSLITFAYAHIQTLHNTASEYVQVQMRFESYVDFKGIKTYILIEKTWTTQTH